MSGVKFKTILVGFDDLQRAMKLAEPKTHARVVAAIEKSTKEVAAKARAAAPKVTGELASTIRDEYGNGGLAGYVKVGLGQLPRRSKAETVGGIKRAKGRVRKVGRGAYAPVVERGDPRRHHQPHPFLMPAYAEQKPTIVNDISHALNDAVADIASGA